MEDIFVDVLPEVEVKAADVSCVTDDEIIDIRDVVIGRSYGDDAARRRVIRYDAYNRPINDRPSDYVSFRYSRYDRYTEPRIIRNPVLDAFREHQEMIDEICSSKRSAKEKREAVRAVVNKFAQFLRGQNIRYRNLWRNFDTHSVVPSKQIW